MIIKVLHVIDHLGYGGAPIVVKSIVERLNSNDIEIFVCALRTNQEAIPIQTNLISLNYNKYNPFSFREIVKLCKKNKIDIIHAHLQKSVISSLLAGIFCNAKIIVHEHGPVFRKGTGFMYRLLFKSLASKATLAIANSQATKTALQEKINLPEQSIHIVNNFVDVSRFDPNLYDRKAVRNTLGLKNDNTTIGFVGRLDHCKGIDLLIRALQSLTEKDQKYRLVIVGNGSQKESLEQMTHQLGLNDKVIFTGLSKNPAELMCVFDMAVIPSRREAFGITAIEFMRMKIPVIASNAGGLVELIQDNKTGLLLYNLNPDNITRAVIKLEKDDALRENLIKNAEVFSKKFDGREQLKQIMQIYSRLIDRKA